MPCSTASKFAGIFIYLFATSAFGETFQRYSWKPEGAQDGCQISMSTVPGKEYVAAKATCVIAANIEVIATLLRDIEGYPEWMHGCSQTKLLKVVDSARGIYLFWFRQHVTLFTDRDMVLKSEIVVHEGERRVIKADLTTDAVFNSPDKYVRMPYFQSEWVLEKIDEHQTRVSFMIDPDLGKGLPLGISNSTIIATPFRSIQGLKKVANNSK